MFISYQESLINLDHVAHIHLFENEIHFSSDKRDPKNHCIEKFEAWYFVNEEEAKSVFNEIISKTNTLVFKSIE